MKEVQSALSTAAADDSKLVLLSAVGSVFCCGLDFIYFIRRLTDDRKRESTKMAEAIRYAEMVFFKCWFECFAFSVQMPDRTDLSKPCERNVRLLPLRNTSSEIN